MTYDKLVIKLKADVLNTDNIITIWYSYADCDMQNQEWIFLVKGG